MNSETWLCDVCADVFGTYSALESHAKAEHPEHWDSLAGPTPFDMEYARLLHILAKEHLVVRNEIPSDGNCQFAAFADQLERLGRGILSPQDLRRMSVSYLRNNPKLPGPDASNVADFVDGKDLPRYLRQMEEEGTWGDHLTLQALSNIWNVRVCIVSSSSDYLIYINPLGMDSRAEVILLGHISEEHYVSLDRGEQNVDHGDWDDTSYTYSGLDDVDSSSSLLPLPDLPTSNSFEVLTLKEEGSTGAVIDLTLGQGSSDEDRKKEEMIPTIKRRRRARKLFSSTEKEELIPTNKRRRRARQLSSSSEEEDNKAPGKRGRPQCHSPATEGSTGAVIDLTLGQGSSDEDRKVGIFIRVTSTN
ncbi:uncharacterized protein LOC144883508 [Branchiostoma floridae x Branchiostoma japonicum]